MFLQLPLTAMRTAFPVTPLKRFAANQDKYNSAVRKAGSFEGTLPRCLSLRATESKWATLGNFFGFSVDSDFVNGRYVEYRSFALVLRHRRFGTARRRTPEFDGSRSRMNSESPFRISSMVLTVASILCGISAASYLAAQFSPRRNSVQSK